MKTAQITLPNYPTPHLIDVQFAYREDGSFHILRMTTQTWQGRQAIESMSPLPNFESIVQQCCEEQHPVETKEKQRDAKIS